jgi:hypothetical protein
MGSAVTSLKTSYALREAAQTMAANQGFRSTNAFVVALIREHALHNLKVSVPIKSLALSTPQHRDFIDAQLATLAKKRRRQRTSQPLA